jgi:type IV pilus assembly protein PilF
MKLSMLCTLIIGAVLQAGCVTEGAVRAEPASNEEQAEVNLALGVGYLEEQRPDLAIDALLRAIVAEPRRADAHSVLGVAYDQNGSVELAEEHHRRATQLAPRDANTQNRFAVFLCRQNRWTDAEPAFRRAIEATSGPASLTAMINAAGCARGGGDIEAAGRYFREALVIDPINVDALRGMIDISIRSSSYLPARGFWSRLERATSILADDLLTCYVIERELNSDAAAQACADRLAREFPGSPVLSQLRSFEPDGR